MVSTSIPEPTNHRIRLLLLAHVLILIIPSTSTIAPSAPSRMDTTIALMLKECSKPEHCDEPRLLPEAPSLGELGGGCALLHSKVTPNCFDKHAMCSRNITSKQKTCACNRISKEFEFPISGKRLCFIKANQPCDASLFRTAATNSLWDGAMDLFFNVKFLDDTIKYLKKTTFPSCSTECMARILSILQSFKPYLSSVKDERSLGCLSGICNTVKSGCDRRGTCKQMIGKCAAGSTSAVLTRAAKARNSGQMNKSMFNFFMMVNIGIVLHFSFKYLIFEAV